MGIEVERRREKRLRYNWPVWYAEDFSEMLSQGQMVDVSSGGAAFTCYSHEKIPFAGQEITARFSVPKFGADDSFDMSSFTRKARVCRVDEVNNYLKRVALQFNDPLPFKPGQQAETEDETQDRLRSVAI